MSAQPVLNVQHGYAIERAIRFLEASATQIDLANPGDPYASLMVREDIAMLNEAAAIAKATGSAA